MMQDVTLQMVKLLVFDAVIAFVLVGLLIPLRKMKCASYAVLKKNFLSYFSNPTGYVFICLFVFLCSVAAFWSRGFFEDNLATLSQLNYWFPFIMLLFAPAITMSTWAAERNEGTDELLLTIPASDVDVVLGKYLAASAIYTVSLLISQVTILFVLSSLAEGEVDLSLFITTYVGYWFVGLAMIALGMAASFLTSNLTVAFVLGALINAPLVCLSLPDRLFANRDLAQALSSWSISSRFDDFGRGVISLSSTTFFVLVAVLGIYLSLIFIGRRHWLGGRDGQAMLPHFVARGVALGAIALSVSLFLSYRHFGRLDFTRDNVNSLSNDAHRVLSELDGEQQVLIEAFISKSVPKQYVQTKTELINLLRAFDLEAGSDIEVRIYDEVEPYTALAERAADEYGIEMTTMSEFVDSRLEEEEFYMAAAFKKGLDRVVIPFFYRGVPVEYELVRSLATVNRAKRKRIGIVRTDAQLFGGFDMQTFQQRPKERIVLELEKQYDVEEVDISNPVTEGKYDVLVAVQPSSLTAPQLDNLMAAIRNGQPTAIFEDPLPYFYRGTVPGTGEPRRPAGGMMGMMGGGRQPEPKGDFQRLCTMLGVEMVGRTNPMGGPYDAEIIWQFYNPYGNKLSTREISNEWVFVSPDADGAEGAAFNSDDDVTEGLSEVLLLYPGAVREVGSRDLKFTSLMMTGDQTGTIDLQALQAPNGMPRRIPTGKRYTVAARIKGQIKDDLRMADDGSPEAPAEAAAANAEAAAASAEGDADAASDPRNREVHVVFVTDIDVLSSTFVTIRERPDDQIKWKFENVTFVLNLIDSLAGDDALIEVRSRKLRHSTLKRVDTATDAAREEAARASDEFETEYETAIEEYTAEAQKDSQQLQEEVNRLQQEGNLNDPEARRSLQEKMRRLVVEGQLRENKVAKKTEQLQKEKEQKLKEIHYKLQQQIKDVQSRYKTLAAFLPPIPPLLVGLIVLAVRRSKESVGIVDERRK
ncbi:MAG: Gldg family protein [Planctomycetales bacterium]|nr:Gldg family protein [Planctomycetales bacterium]